MGGDLAWSGAQAGPTSAAELSVGAGVAEGLPVALSCSEVSGRRLLKKTS